MGNYINFEKSLNYGGVQEQSGTSRFLRQDNAYIAKSLQLPQLKYR